MARRGRSGGRAGRAAARASEAPSRDPYIKRNIPTYSVLNDTDLAQLEQNADTLLEEVGLEIQEDPESIDYFVKAGAKADGDRVRFPRGMCREIIQATAPKEFTQYARNPANMFKLAVTIQSSSLPMVRHLYIQKRADDVTPISKIFAISSNSRICHLIYIIAGARFVSRLIYP